MKLVRRILPHLVIALSVVFVVFLVLNNYNPIIGLLSNRCSRPLLLALCLLALCQSVIVVHDNRK